VTAKGHQDAFPRPRLNARCWFSQETFAGSQGNGRGASAAGGARFTGYKAHGGVNSLRSACCGLAAAIGSAAPLFPTLPSIVILEEKVGIHRWSWQLLKLPKATTKRRVRTV
jgi:hypothetical protein